MVPSLSAVIITFNEESNIERCIKSLHWADEILIVDSHSKDQTVSKANSLGARVESLSWQGYGPQKHRAAEMAKHDWILSVDADEEVSPELAQEIQNQLKSLDPKLAFRLPRCSKYLGRWIRHGGWYPDYQVRLFHRKHAQWNSALIHEKVEASGYANLTSNLNHYVFKSISHQVATNDKYSSLQAEQEIKNGKTASLHRLLIKPFVKFVECYFLKLGFLDGFPGFLIAIGAGYSVFLRWSKVWEKNQGGQNA